MSKLRLDRAPLLRSVPARLKRVDQDVALFQSWQGKFSDSPRAISEELHRRSSSVRQVWVTGPDGGGAPSWSTPVAAGSPRYLAELGRAGFVVSNNTLPGYFRKKAGTTYLQTWHGTPLKRIAFDVPASSTAVNEDYLRDLAREVRSWDYLLSPNRFSTEVLRSAFRYEGEILETGYPRNDLLSSPRSQEVRHQTRDQLGIADGVRAVLYAPTWRDGQAFSLKLDLNEMEDAFGSDQVVLFRAHGLDAALEGRHRSPAVIDVSELADVRELYLAADVLITDYSSVMFDFAVTGKPILLFTYDLEEYRDQLRGFYFDLETDAPGPLLRTSRDVRVALSSLDDVAAEHSVAYARFRERFCHLDDGGASARVVDAVFGG